MGQSNNFWGNMIVELRSTKNLSQRKLAVGAGVNRSTLRRIEDGSSRGDIEIIEKLLYHMGYELEAMSHESLDARAMLPPPPPMLLLPPPKPPTEDRVNRLLLFGLSV